MTSWRARATVGAFVLAGISAGSATAQSADEFLKALGQTAKTAVQQKMQQSQQQRAAATPPPTQGPLGRVGLEAMGYSAQFGAVRGRIEAGDFDGALVYFPDEVKPAASSTAGSGASAPTGPTPLARDPFLRNVEAGAIEFEAGRFPEAAIRLSAAEAVSAPPPGEASHGFAATARKAGNVIDRWTRKAVSTVAGQGELGPYPRRDHEAVLQLNYLALSYLLQGDRKSYNVARRAIDRQKELKAKFDVDLQEYKAKYAKQNEDNKRTLGDSPASGPTSASAADGVRDEVSKYSAIATLVPNAYVNPLGDYLAGVIQEIAASEQPSLRDNARISFDAARVLAGQSPQMAAAAKALARDRIPASERVLHVVVGEGFAPARQVLTYRFTIQGSVLIARVPIFTPVPSNVAALEIRSMKGAPLARLDPIGNFEAIVLRDQQDRMPETLFGVAATTAASYGEAQLAAKAGDLGMRAYQLKQAAEKPDTRSWSTLPRRFHVARFTIPAKMTQVQLVSLNAAGRVLFSTTLALDPTKTESFVYARATDGALRALPARKLWIDGRLGDS